MYPWAEVSEYDLDPGGEPLGDGCTDYHDYGVLCAAALADLESE